MINFTPNIDLIEVSKKLWPHHQLSEPRDFNGFTVFNEVFEFFYIKELIEYIIFIIECF